MTHPDQETHKIPRNVPAFVEVAPDAFRSVEELKVSDWRLAEKLEEGWRKRVVRRMLKLADICHAPADGPLLPYIKAVALSQNVTLLHFQ